LRSAQDSPCGSAVSSAQRSNASCPRRERSLAACHEPRFWWRGTRSCRRAPSFRCRILHSTNRCWSRSNRRSRPLLPAGGAFIPLTVPPAVPVPEVPLSDARIRATAARDARSRGHARTGDDRTLAHAAARTAATATRPPPAANREHRNARGGAKGPSNGATHPPTRHGCLWSTSRKRREPALISSRYDSRHPIPSCQGVRLIDAPTYPGTRPPFQRHPYSP
jgi:hypothetical protein